MPSWIDDDTYSSDEGYESNLSKEAKTSSDGLEEDEPSAGTLLEELFKGVVCLQMGLFMKRLLKDDLPYM